MDLELGLEFADPPLGRCQLGPLDRGQAGDEAAVDLLLVAPQVDRLAADPEVAGQVGRPPTGRQQVERASTELGWIPTSSQGCLP